MTCQQDMDFHPGSQIRLTNVEITIVIITLFLLILLFCRYCYGVGSIIVIANPVIMFNIIV